MGRRLNGRFYPRAKRTAPRVRFHQKFSRCSAQRNAG
jgi:hypothetical protein